MKLKANLTSILVSLLVGAIIGRLGGPVWVLIPWAIVGLIIGALTDSIEAALMNGAAYGFTLAYVFMISGYSGAAPISTRLIPFLALGVVGAICGLVLASISYFAKGMMTKSS